MRKVCPTCDGNGKVRLQIGPATYIDDVACLDCNETGYIDVPEDSNEEVKETANIDNQ